MARQDEILKSFLKHEIFKDKYEINPADLPSTVKDARKSKFPIIVAIAMIIEKLEPGSIITNDALKIPILQYLNSAAI